jgi:hypothetical protein
LVIAFADVTVLRFHDFSEIGVVFDFVLLEIVGRIEVGGGEDRLGPEFSNARFGEDFLVASDLVGFTLADPGFDLASPLIDIGAEYVAGGAEETFALVGGKRVEEGAILDDGFEGGEGITEAVGIGHG